MTWCRVQGRAGRRWWVGWVGRSGSGGAGPLPAGHYQACGVPTGRPLPHQAGYYSHTHRRANGRPAQSLWGHYPSPHLVSLPDEIVGMPQVLPCTHKELPCWQTSRHSASGGGSGKRARSQPARLAPAWAAPSAGTAATGSR